MEGMDAAAARTQALIAGPDPGWDYSPCDGLELPQGVAKPEPGQAPNPALERLAPGIVRAIKRERHPALQAVAAALLVDFLVMLYDALTPVTDEETKPT